jgi:hypothetical protein
MPHPCPPVLAFPTMPMFPDSVHEVKDWLGPRLLTLTAFPELAPAQVWAAVWGGKPLLGTILLSNRPPSALTGACKFCLASPLAILLQESSSAASANPRSGSPHLWSRYRIHIPVIYPKSNSLIEKSPLTLNMRTEESAPKSIHSKWTDQVRPGIYTSTSFNNSLSWRMKLGWS